jgi:hypothetical protein
LFNVIALMFTAIGDLAERPEEAFAFGAAALMVVDGPLSESAFGSCLDMTETPPSPKYF